MSLNASVDQASVQKPGDEDQGAGIAQGQDDAANEAANTKFMKEKAAEDTAKGVKFVKGLQSNIMRALESPEKKKDKEVEPFVPTPYTTNHTILATKDAVAGRIWDYQQGQLAKAHDKKVKVAAEAKKAAEAEREEVALQQGVYR